MKTSLLIALALAAGNAFAASAEPKPETVGVFVVSEEFAPKGKAFVPQYARATDALAIAASGACPAGYDKLAERVRGEGETPRLIWEVRCITPPATPVASATPAPR